VDPTHGIFVYQRVAHLARRKGNESQIIAPLPYFPRWLGIKRWKNSTQVPAHEEIGGLAVYHPRYFLLPRVSMPWQGISMFLGSLPLAKKIHRCWRIDCIDAHYVYPDGLAAVLLGKYLGVPVMVSARGTDINLFPTLRLIRSMICWTLKQAAGVIAVSTALKEAMGALGVERDKIHVVTNGVDAVRFQPVPSADARRSLGLPGDGPIIVTVGTLISSKGHELTIRAFAQIRKRHESLQLYILGEGLQRASLEALVSEFGLRETVHFMGKRPNDELPLWFSAATVSCLASAREGWPNVVTESLACGTPVVATRVGGIPEILHSEELGILVDQTVESVGEGLARAIGKAWDREAISTRTHSRTWDQVAAEIEEIFKAHIGLRNLSNNKSTTADSQMSP
jgi:teichuronic acid biosynthesis glycosyltransferase TuaC